MVKSIKAPKKPMKEGECRIMKKTGMRYCKLKGKVRITGKA